MVQVDIMRIAGLGSYRAIRECIDKTGSLKR